MENAIVQYMDDVVLQHHQDLLLKQHLVILLPSGYVQVVIMVMIAKNVKDQIILVQLMTKTVLTPDDDDHHVTHDHKSDILKTSPHLLVTVLHVLLVQIENHVITVR